MAGMDAVWTIDELADRVAGALVTADYPGAPNGRVREVPDRRAIRWYATIGLLDRPGAMRGRTALYGPRHLLQLVAIKRRQAEGRSLAEIQSELVGASDEWLRGVAAIPEHLLVTPGPAGGDAPRARFWVQPPVPPAPPLPPPPPPLLKAPPGLLTGVPLGGGVILLVPVPPGADDVAALHAAASPLLDALADRGLLDPNDTSRGDSR